MVETHKFGDALEALKEGKTVSRLCWFTGSKTLCKLKKGNKIRIGNDSLVYPPELALTDPLFGDRNWNPNMIDILSEDWIIFDDVKV